MIKKLIAIDLVPMEHRAQAFGLPYMPITEIIRHCSEGDTDIIETLVTLTRRTPEKDSEESLAKVTQQFNRKKYALQLAGARVIECPSKFSHGGYKQSDDQRLMLTTLMLAMKLKPDYVMLFAGDGDFAPLVEVLRGEGIRTEIVAPLNILAGELRRHAARVIDFDAMLKQIIEKYNLPTNVFMQPRESAQEPSASDDDAYDDSVGLDDASPEDAGAAQGTPQEQ